jgi:hypothetical protein
MYKMLKNPTEKDIGVVCKQDGNTLISIPFDPANTDYADVSGMAGRGQRAKLPADETPE